MTDFKLDTPVGLLVFNRPGMTQKILNAVRLVKPRKLFISADGPRPNTPDDTQKCATVRELITHIDWDCEVSTRFSDANLGCGLGPATGISWIFEQVEEAIILEDDCLPSQDFFRFCQDVLERFRDDERVMLVSGTNMFGEWKSGQLSYHFSKYGGIGGWASWRRAWRHFDFEMKLWGDEEVRDRLRDFLGEKNFRLRKNVYDKTYLQQGVTWWDYQWGFARHIQSGLAVVPCRNLVSNIGFGPDATHAASEEASRKFGNRPVFNLEFPLKHNAFVVADREYDDKLIRMISEGTLQKIIGAFRNRVRKVCNYR